MTQNVKGVDGVPAYVRRTNALEADWEECRNRPLPPTPTDAVPGSVEKLKVMKDRRHLGYQLHHPGDYQYNPGNVSKRTIALQKSRRVRRVKLCVVEESKKG